MAEFDKSIIYESVVDAIGLTLDDSSSMFKTEVLGHINASLGILHQAGCGLDMYVDETTTWIDFFGASGSQGMAKQFVFTKVKMLVDPPIASTLKAMQALCDELLWRVEVAEGSTIMTLS